MPAILEYTLSLEDRVSGTLEKIGIANDRQLAVWAKVQRQVVDAQATFEQCGVSLGSLRERVAALRAEREWIPAGRIEAIRRSNSAIRQLEGQIRRLESAGSGGKLRTWFDTLRRAAPSARTLFSPLRMLSSAAREAGSVLGDTLRGAGSALGGTLRGLRSAAGGLLPPMRLISAAARQAGAFLRGSQEAWNTRLETEHRLAAAMRQHLGASQAETDGILRLAAAQQAAGVVGEQVQLSGARQLTGYLTRRKSLEQLLPVMNDLVAQQHGLNATGQDAAAVGELMGRAMAGQTDALSQAGVVFTEAEQRMMRLGDEQQRAHTLAQAVARSAGGMNRTLAETPEGRLRQHANTMLTLQERIGRLRAQIMDALLPLFDSVGDALAGVVGWFERNRETIIGGVRLIARAIGGAFSVVSSVVGGVADLFGGWIGMLRQGNTPVLLLTGLLTSLAGALALMTLKAKAAAIWAGIVKGATAAWTAVQNGLNLAMLMNPITWIVAAIIALIGVIAYVAYTTEGWGKTWENTMEWIKLSFAQAGAWLELKWLQVQDCFLTGFEVIEKGWYKLKGLWDKEGAQEGLARIEAERNARAEKIAAARGKIDSLAAQRKAIDVWQVQSNGKSLSDVTGGLKRQMGMAPAPGGPTGGLSGGTLSAGSGSQTVSSISSGGGRAQGVVVNLRSLVENLVFEGGFEGNREQMQRDLESSLIRVLEMANTAR